MNRWLAFAILCITPTCGAQDIIDRAAEPASMVRLTATRPAMWQVIQPAEFRAFATTSDARECFLYTGDPGRTLVVLSIVSGETPEQPPIAAKYLIKIAGPPPAPAPPGPTPAPPEVPNALGVGLPSYMEAVKVGAPAVAQRLSSTFQSAANWLASKPANDESIQAAIDKVKLALDRDCDASWAGFRTTLEASFSSAWEAGKIRTAAEWVAGYQEVSAALALVR